MRNQAMLGKGSFKILYYCAKTSIGLLKIWSKSLTQCFDKNILSNQLIIHSVLPKGRFFTENSTFSTLPSSQPPSSYLHAIHLSWCSLPSDIFFCPEPSSHLSLPVITLFLQPEAESFLFYLHPSYQQLALFNVEPRVQAVANIRKGIDTKSRFYYVVLMFATYGAKF